MSPAPLWQLCLLLPVVPMFLAYRLRLGALLCGLAVGWVVWVAFLAAVLIEFHP